jgi:sulfite reductase alpha subunit-like flavoprotein
VWDLLHGEEGLIYVCGSASRVGKSVKEIVIQIISEHLEQNEEKGREKEECENVAEQYLQQLIIEKRYCEDVWG